MRAARFAAALAVMLVIGVAGVAWGDNGQPLILGSENTATNLTELRGNLSVGTGISGTTSLTTNENAKFDGWVSTGTGFRFVTGEGTGSSGPTLGRATIHQGATCRMIAGAAAPNPMDARSIPLVFTGIVGIHPGVYVIGTQVRPRGLEVCLNRPAPTDIKINWIDVDYGNQE